MTPMPPERECLRAAEPRLALLYDLPLLLLSAAALPVSWQCSLIPVYRQSPQCGERSNAAFGKQSTVQLPSLAPHNSKTRLISVTIRRRFMAKPCTPHPIAQRVQIFKPQTGNVGGRGDLPSRSLGGLRGPFSHAREWPPLLASLRGAKDLRPHAAGHTSKVI